ncbi:low affinity iron permease family protein [Candidatus Microgenomates bacterium]|nr:low affinity iron permease family protein [Candidatus Microgenomates bacterium]
MNELFHRIAVRISGKVGSPSVFMLAMLVILAWAISGPVFGFSDSWQLVINTGTTIVTFLMVFVIQNTQNRDSKAMQLKLDELLRAHRGARNELVDLEDLTDDEIEALDGDFKRIHEQEMSKATKLLHQRIQHEHRRRQTKHQ